MDIGVLHEAYERLHGKGPEWGEDRLTNHGPMAVEVLVRRGRADRVHRWLDRYLPRLDDLPLAGGSITEDNWREALGQQRRVGEWTAFFQRQLQERPWTEVLVAWWPRLLPGVLAGATHGVIRVGHAVRVLRTGDAEPPLLAELANGLAFWAARMTYAPELADPTGPADPGTALDRLPRIHPQRGRLADRLARLGALSAWRAPADAGGAIESDGHRSVPGAALPTGEAADRLDRLVAAATRRYRISGSAAPILLVHTATAPNAIRHVLSVLPSELWAASLAAAWSASATLTAGYAPVTAAEAAEKTSTLDSVGVLERAADHGDEHVIKFADTAVEVYEQTGDPAALAAADRAAALISYGR